MKQFVERLSDEGALTIFLFHGVVENSEHEVRNYTRKHLTVDEFQEVVGALSAAGQALSMDEVLERCLSKSAFPKRAFSITFDDGFENNYSVARPILERLKIPATIYVTSRFVEENGMSWIDQSNGRSNAPRVARLGCRGRRLNLNFSTELARSHCWTAFDAT